MRVKRNDEMYFLSKLKWLMSISWSKWGPAGRSPPGSKFLVGRAGFTGIVITSCYNEVASRINCAIFILIPFVSFLLKFTLWSHNTLDIFLCVLHYESVTIRGLFFIIGSVLTFYPKNCHLLTKAFFLNYFKMVFYFVATVCHCCLQSK